MLEARDTSDHTTEASVLKARDTVSNRTETSAGTWEVGFWSLTDFGFYLCYFIIVQLLTRGTGHIHNCDKNKEVNVHLW